MMSPAARMLVVGLAVCGLTAAPGMASALMQWPDLTRGFVARPTERIAYGPGPRQFAELWLPDGPGPHPVVIAVHGGCWQSNIAGLEVMDPLAENLRRRGAAVWNIEYDGVDAPGGGYPGTFQDVARAADALRAVAEKRRLRLDRVVAVGHSAGGHLALWLAARPRLPESSPLRTADPLPISAVVSLGGLPDLKAARAMPEGGCGKDPVDRLTGASTGRAGDVYADTSPAELFPIGVAQLLVHGALDGLSPPSVGAGYQARARKRGEKVRVIVIDGAGHVELIAPRSLVWPRIVREVIALAAPGQGSDDRGARRRAQASMSSPRASL